MARINVFLTDQLLTDINAEAKEEGTNRSALIQAALESHIQRKRLERQEEERQKAMQEASLKMDATPYHLYFVESANAVERAREGGHARHAACSDRVRP